MPPMQRLRRGLSNALPLCYWQTVAAYVLYGVRSDLLGSSMK